MIKTFFYFIFFERARVVTTAEREKEPSTRLVGLDGRRGWVGGVMG